MADLPLKVQPGDLITSEFINQLIDVCDDLRDRVGALEVPTITPAGMTITSVLPSGTKRIGDSIHVIGHGFDVPLGSIVTIDGIGLTPVSGIDPDRELILTIPNLQGVTAVGKNVTLVVSNQKGTDSRDLLVFPAETTTPNGQVFVTLTQPPTDPALVAGQSYIFVYTVRAVSDLDETYALSASVTAGWAVSIVDASDVPIVPSELFLPSVAPPAGASQTIRVRVSIPSNASSGTATTLRVVAASKRNPTGLTGRSGGETITVGNAPPSETRVDITPPDTVGRVHPSQPVPNIANGVVEIGVSWISYVLSYSALIPTAGTYNVQLTPPSDSRWVASFSTSNATLVSTTIGPVPAGSNQEIRVFLRAQAGAPPSEFTLRLTHTTDSSETGAFQQSVRLLP